jgi:hypothetical protein
VHCRTCSPFILQTWPLLKPERNDAISRNPNIIDGMRDPVIIDGMRDPIIIATPDVLPFHRKLFVVPYIIGCNLLSITNARAEESW